MMTGKGAEKFAQQQGIEIVDPSSFYTEERSKGLQRAKREDSTKMQQGRTDKVKGISSGFSEFFYSPLGIRGKYGTVGAVALDRHGNIAMPFCTGGIYSGYIKSDGEKRSG